MLLAEVVLRITEMVQEQQEWDGWRCDAMAPGRPTGRVAHLLLRLFQELRAQRLLVLRPLGRASLAWAIKSAWEPAGLYQRLRGVEMGASSQYQ